MSWPVVALGSVVTFLDQLRRPITAKDRIAGPFPYYGANGQQDSVNSYIFDEPLVLLAEDGGHFDEPQKGVAYRIDGPSWVNNHAHVLRPDESVDVEYLARVLENYDLRPFISGSTRGKLTKASAARVRIPLPPLPEQRRIADILDRADDLRAKRRRALALLDMLAGSMFSILAKKGGVVRTLRDCGVSFSSGKSVVAGGGQEHPINRVLKVNAVSSGVFDPAESKSLPAEYVPPASHRISAGDLLFTRASGSPNLIGVSAFVDIDRSGLYLPDKIWRVVLAEGAQVNLTFLDLLFKQSAFRAYILNESSGAAGVRNISQEKVLGFEAVIPEMLDQEEFVEQIQRIESLRVAHRAGLFALDELFASLQHRAFQGEL